MPDHNRARGVTEAVMAALRESYWDGRDITARAMLRAIQPHVEGLTDSHRPAVTMALTAAEGARLIERVSGGAGSRCVWRKVAALQPRRAPRGFDDERTDVVPPRAAEVMVPLSAVIEHLPDGHPLRKQKGRAS
jgi:hypothetical protein